MGSRELLGEQGFPPDLARDCRTPGMGSAQYRDLATVTLLPCLPALHLGDLGSLGSIDPAQIRELPPVDCRPEDRAKVGEKS